jgi:hypothetical protein
MHSCLLKVLNGSIFYKTYAHEFSEFHVVLLPIFKVSFSDIEGSRNIESMNKPYK